MGADVIELAGRGIEADSEGADSLLYHYTSATGLMGIVKNREVWATESNHLNDPTEVSYASQVLVSLLTDHAAGESGVERTRTEHAIELLERAYSDPNSAEQYVEDRSYITSFSRTDHSLTLWRLYAGQNGFCVGFDKGHLLEWLGHDHPTGDRDSMYAEERERYDALVANFALAPRLQDVEYGSDPVLSVFHAVLAIPFDEGNSGANEGRLRETFKRLSGIKHEAFADEREVRLVVQDNYHVPDPKVRVSAAGLLVAYRSVVFPFEAVRSITMAPGANAPRTRRALNSLLSTGGRGAWGHVEVRGCDLPFVW